MTGLDKSPSDHIIAIPVKSAALKVNITHIHADQLKIEFSTFFLDSLCASCVYAVIAS